MREMNEEEEGVVRGAIPVRARRKAIYALKVPRQCPLFLLAN
jgi:hypothetical protein